ncbi:MAG: carboxypeptidase-like regulatory domain-containing protein [Dysgonamonadaceae bacterium]|jgi:hypothetical protein|nr:carboxypeptidase-like regulatory domain-containing protein [Dysgonamonadaceae bacterium]
MKNLSKMKSRFGYLFAMLVTASLTFVSCNEDEGFGGKASIEGYVYEVVHFDDNYSFRTDTLKDGKYGTKVYITAKDDNQVLDDVDTGPDGYYRFDYLRKGDYRVYCVSEDKFRNQTPEMVNVKAGSSGTVKAEPIYYHKGDIYNTAMIKGKVWIRYCNNIGTNIQVRIAGKYYDSIPAVAARVYIANPSDSVSFADTRGDGVFMFKELRPNQEYQVYAITEVKSSVYFDARNVETKTDAQTVVVGEPYKYYPPLKDDGTDSLSITIWKNLKR